MTAPGGGEVVVPAWPVRTVGHEPPACARVPGIGEHTVEVLHETGYDDADLDTFRAAGLIRP